MSDLFILSSTKKNIAEHIKIEINKKDLEARGFIYKCKG